MADDDIEDDDAEQEGATDDVSLKPSGRIFRDHGLLRLEGETCRAEQ